VCKVDHDILALYDLNAYVNIDDDVTAETQTEEDIAMELKIKKKKNELEEEDHNQETEVAVPTLSEALEAIRTVNRFYEARSENMKLFLKLGKSRTI
jgi:hypothetical protein